VARDTPARVTRRAASPSSRELSRPRSSRSRAAGAAALVAALGAPATALADTSAWASVSGGVALHEGEPAPESTTDAAASGEDQVAPQLQADVGVGTTSAAPVIVGGLLRVSPTFGQHTDFALVARGATRGFQTGPFGVALEAGGYARADDEASVGFVGGAVLGGPLGVQLTVLAHVGTTDEYGGSALLGVDLLRLTLYREDVVDWWPNPLPPEHDVTAAR
jgi:hypothetical protein